MPFLAVLAIAGAVSGAPAVGCDGNMREMEECYGERLAKHEATLATYVSAARDRIGREAAETPSGLSSIESALGGFDAAQAAWSTFRNAECGAVYDYWSMGSIRGLKSLRCRTIPTQQRTHTIWTHWLRYEDSSPPILPEPPPATFP